jgi:hypothetical protein
MVTDARLRILGLRPLELLGEGFRPEEKVRLTVSLGRDASAALTVPASGAGAFTVRFPELRVDRCAGTLRVEAAGAAGSRAGFTLDQLAR